MSPRTHRLVNWIADRGYSVTEDLLVICDVLVASQTGKEMMREMSKLDYNFSLLLVLLAVILGITGLAALGALMMFLTAFV